MDREQQIALEYKLIERLKGRLRLLQTAEDREQLVKDALRELFHGDEKGRFKKQMEKLVDKQTQDKFVKDFLSYGIIQEYLGDFEVEDIIINSLNSIYIHHSQKGLVPTGIRFASIVELELFVEKLVLFSGRSDVSPLMNIELPNLEGRVNYIESPFGPQLTITKIKMTPLSIIDLIKREALTFEAAAQLWLYLDGLSIRPANIIISGGPGVGKTTLLNALFSFIPASDRMVVIEDTLELNTEFEDSCSRLESGEDFNLADLVKNSLRMRPERIIIGEVRGEEARDMMTAANIGKYCIGTMHALTSREAIVRLQNEPMNIPEELIRLVDVFIVMKRYHVEKRLFRVVDEISETSGMEQSKVLLSHIYKYDYETNQLNNLAASTIYRDRLAQAAGITPKEIMLEVQLRGFFLEELAKRELTTLREVTSFCRDYATDPDEAVAKLGFDRQQMLGARDNPKKKR